MSRKPYSMYTDEHHIVKVWRGQNSAIAKCNPEDTFCLRKGLDLALSRLEDVENGYIVSPQGGNYYRISTSNGSVSYATFISCWLEDKLNAALKNAFVSEEAAKAHADDVLQKYYKVIAYAETL